MAVGERIDLSPERWGVDEIDRCLEYARRNWFGAPEGGHAAAHGDKHAIAGTSGALAIRAGLEALRCGGTAADAAVTTALLQITSNFGAVVSFAGLMSMVYFEAATGQVHSLNGGFNTVRGEKEPLKIPGIKDPLQHPWDSNPSGRSALVPGFIAGVEAAHHRFGRLPWRQLFEPSLYFAERGLPVEPGTAHNIKMRIPVINRRPKTTAVFKGPDGEFLKEGDVFRQSALAQTLQNVARHGATYMYRGGWAEKLVAAVAEEGGRMTLEDLAAYEPIWSEPVRSTYRGYEVAAYGLPGLGGLSAVEAFNLLELTGLADGPSYRESPEKFATFITITKLWGLMYAKPQALSDIVPGLDLSPEARSRKETSQALWDAVMSRRLDADTINGFLRYGLGDAHTASIVAVDGDGNACALVHSTNAVVWGGTGIFVDGVSIPDPASFQQAIIARVEPGKRLPDPTNPLIVLKNGRPVLVSGAVGSVHERTMQCAVSVLDYGMEPKTAVDAPSFLKHNPFGKGGPTTLVAAGDFTDGFLDSVRALGPRIDVIPRETRTFQDGKWLGIYIETGTGRLLAADAGAADGHAEAD